MREGVCTGEEKRGVACTSEGYEEGKDYTRIAAPPSASPFGSYFIPSLCSVLES